jgi:NAD(P)-dependent dehydrogenase (short-subunit alcohol dehydrogenase family)
MFDLSGKVALVAGGTGYLGFPVAQALAKQGAAVVVASRDLGRIASAVTALRAAAAHDRVLGLQLDMGDERSIQETVTTALERFGRLDILVNATFGGGRKRFDELDATTMDQANHVHITGGFLLARSAAEAMDHGGSIITYSSMYGLVAPDLTIYSPPLPPNPVEYGMAKAALCQMTRYLAAHYGPRGIRVNAVAPGAFTNPRPDFPADEAYLRRQAAKTMLGRIGRRDETAGAVVFLASDESSYVTGTVLCIDGGWTAW